MTGLINGRLGRDSLIWSTVSLLFGSSYLLIPYDVIPDGSPYGYCDEVALIAASVIAAWLLTPQALRRTLVTTVLFRIRVARDDLGNFGLVQHRYVDGFLISGKNSGSHWLKYMLSVGLAAQHGLVPPRYCTGRQADAIVGRASRQRRGRSYPQIATSHTIPSVLLAYPPLRGLFHEPPIVLLVRNIPDALRSNYLKWSAQYNTVFADFVQGDPSGNRFIADVWWYIRFFNRWGVLARNDPSRILVVRYEDIRADPALWLGAIADHLNLHLSIDAINIAAAAGSKDSMRGLQDPDAGETVVPLADHVAPELPNVSDWYLKTVLARHLRYDLGYRLEHYQPEWKRLSVLRVSAADKNARQNDS